VIRHQDGSVQLDFDEVDVVADSYAEQGRFDVAAWLRERAGEVRASGADAVLVTFTPTRELAN
jgi:hypothetical protein